MVVFVCVAIITFDGGFGPGTYNTIHISYIIRMHCYLHVLSKCRSRLCEVTLLFCLFVYIDDLRPSQQQ